MFHNAQHVQMGTRTSLLSNRESKFPQSYPQLVEMKKKKCLDEGLGN